MKQLFFSLFFVLILCVSFNVQAQNLIIVSTGQTGISGTNWSISGNTLNVAASGTANVHPSVISNHLNNVGDLTVILPGQSGVRRQCSIDETITYTGTATRTLTFVIANDIFITTPTKSISATNGALNVVLRAATSLSPDDGRISFRNNTINTNGGHLWMGGGSGTTTWNNLTVGNSVARTWQDDIPGLWIASATLNTNGGNVYLAGLSHNSGDDIGLNHGVLIDNSNIASASGNIEIRGDLKGKFTNGYGIAIFSSTGTNAITATTGSINIVGDGSDQATNGGWRHGLVFSCVSALNPLTISTTSGNIQLEGNANFAATVNDKEGLILGTAGLGIVSRTGNINIKGSNTLETSGQFSNSIRFASLDVLNAIRIGFDGTNIYSGNITIEGNSIYQRYQNAGSGSIAVQTTGNLTIQPTGNSFTLMRAGDTGTLTFDNDWNFGTTLGSFTLGKTANNANITFSNNLSVAGTINILGGNVTVDADLTSSAIGDILIKGIGNSNPCILINSSRTINKSAGTGTITLQGHSRVQNSGTISATGTGRLNVVMWSDFDNSNNDGGVSHMGTISTNGGHVWLGGSNSNGGSYTWNGLTVGDGPSIGSNSYNNNPLDLHGPINTSNGDVLAWAGDGIGGSAIVGNANTSINAGTGTITLIADQVYTLSTFPINTTGVISLVPNGGSYATALTLGGTLTSGDFSFNTSHYNGLRINNMSTVRGLTIGRTEELLSSGTPVVFGNSSNVTISSALSIAGPITVYGGTITANANLTSTATTGTGISLVGQLIRQSVGVQVNTSGANISYAAQGFNFTAGNNPAIDFSGTSVLPAIVNAAGGNITLNGSYGLTGQAGGDDYAVRLAHANLITRGTGTISITGDASETTTTLLSRGVSLQENTLLQTEHGAITLTGTGGKASSSSRGIAVDSNSVKILSATGDILFNDLRPSGLVGNYNGFLLNPINGHIIIGSDGSTVLSGTSTASTSNVTIQADRMTFIFNNSFFNQINTSGNLVLESVGNSFLGALSLANLSIANGVGSVRIGKTDNTQGVTLGRSIMASNGITVNGETITLNANLSTTNNGHISLFTDNPLGGLTTARTLTAAGAFKYIPRTTTFSADVVYPITGLTVTSTGLTIGNATNDKNITINANVSGGAGIELYGNNVNINSNLTTTGSGSMHLKGNTTIAAGSTITSGGNFTHNGNLTFKSDINGTAAFGPLGGTFTKGGGVSTVERFIPAKRGWRILTAPLKGASNTTVPNNWQGVNGEGLLLFSPATYQSQTMTGYTTGGSMPNIWKYNSADTQWQSIPNLTNENLFNNTVNNGFLVFATGPQASTNIATGQAETTLKPKGDLITGSVSHALTAGKYHLIGNPYASPLNTVAMTQANANSKIWLIDPTLSTVGGYYAYDGANWVPGTPTASDAYIQSGQGFFVRTPANSTFNILESHKVTGNSNTWFLRAANNPADKIRVLLYKQDNADWQLADGILAVNSASGNNEVDNTDTGKMSNFNENLMFRNGTTNLSIEYRALPTASTTQPMRLTGTTVQPYQLRVRAESYTNANLQPYIQDTQTGTVTPVPTDGSEVMLPFTGVAASSTNPDDRFRIIYQSILSINDANILSVGVNPNPVNAGVFTVLLKENTTMARYTLTNLLGQQVQEGNLKYLSNNVNVTSVQTGIYILQVEQEGKTFSTKLIIK